MRQRDRTPTRIGVPTTDRPSLPVLVCIPTYDEALNIESIVARVRAAQPLVDVLIADDGSPDGTGAIADRLAAADEHVHVLHRPVKAGLGAAYLEAFAWGRTNGAGVLVEMDADGSHRPEELGRLLAAIDRGADLVLGSRWVPGGAIRNWPKRRILLSRAGNLWARAMTGVPLHDPTGGFRAFRTTGLDRLDLEGVESRGYCFQVDLARRAVAAGLVVAEVPITFEERVNGVSKMTGAIVAEALVRTTRWGLERAVHGLREVAGSRARPYR